jgi:hypothetical protein
MKQIRSCGEFLFWSLVWIDAVCAPGQESRSFYASQYRRLLLFGEDFFHSRIQEIIVKHCRLGRYGIHKMDAGFFDAPCLLRCHRLATLS